MFYACFDEVTGVCVQTGYCQDGLEDSQRQDSITLVTDSQLDPSTVYLHEGVVLSLPLCPGPFYMWNATLAIWELPLTSLPDFKKYSADLIDTSAGNARKRYITTSPGQDATYTAKYAEAQKYRDAGYPTDLTGYPFISAESAPNSSRSPTDTADRIINLGDAWGSVIGPLIEGTRINGKDALAALSTSEEITTHTAAVIAALDAI